MKLIIGIGNPGERYKNTRHNVGFMLLDQLKSKGLKGFILNKSDKFMNESGSFVMNLVSQYSNIPVSNFYIAHDDLDIKLGEFKIQFGKGPKVHNGVSSVENELGTKDFWRIRIGVDNRNNDSKIPGKKYVLEDFTKSEEDKIQETLQILVGHLKTLPK